MEDAEKIAEKVYGSLETPEKVEVIAKKEDIREEMPEAVYVVVDVMYFSTTSVEILEGGADDLIVYRELKDKEDTEATLLGGERDPRYDAAEGYDLFNSPSFVKELDVEGHNVGLRSTNGAEAVHRIEESAKGEFKTLIGSTINAEAVAEELRGTDKPVYIIACGRSGSRMKEDFLGAYLTAQHLKGEVNEELSGKVSEAVDEAVKHYYETVPDVRAKDIEEHIKKVDSSNEVPEKFDTDPIRFQ